MTTVTTCLNCGARLRLPDRPEGQPIVCPKCKAEVTTDAKDHAALAVSERGRQDCTYLQADPKSVARPPGPIVDENRMEVSQGHEGRLAFLICAAMVLLTVSIISAVLLRHRESRQVISSAPLIVDAPHPTSTHTTATSLPSVTGADPLQALQPPSTPFAAVRAQDMTALKTFLDNAWDVNSPDEDGKTALHVAVNSMSISIVQMLLEARADPNASDGSGRTPLELAVESRWSVDEKLVM
ncbi:MAG: ankyrin repeat domain-containing protein, partial [Mycobacterium sp.]